MSVDRGHRRLWRYPPFVAAALWVPGCSGSGDNLARQPVAGTVLVDGHRLAYGTIMFYPEDRAPRDSTVVSGDLIVNGRFSIPRNKGPVPGKHKIVVSAEKKQKARTDPEPGPAKAEPSDVEKIAARFNIKSELKIEIMEGGIKDLKLELESE